MRVSVKLVLQQELHQTLQYNMVQVQLAISARGLQNVAGVFKGTSYPFAVVTKIATKHGEQPEVLGKTEV